MENTSRQTISYWDDTVKSVGTLSCNFDLRRAFAINEAAKITVCSEKNIERSLNSTSNQHRFQIQYIKTVKDVNDFKHVKYCK